MHDFTRNSNQYGHAYDGYGLNVNQKDVIILNDQVLWEFNLWCVPDERNKISNSLEHQYTTQFYERYNQGKLLQNVVDRLC